MAGEEWSLIPFDERFVHARREERSKLRFGSALRVPALAASAATGNNPGMSRTATGNNPGMSRTATGNNPGMSRTSFFCPGASVVCFLPLFLQQPLLIEPLNINSRR